MNETWRMWMGTPTPPSLPPTQHVPYYSARRSADDAISHRRKNPISDDSSYPDFFDDVFGGPPRSSLSRQFSLSSFQRSPPPPPTARFSYEEIFQAPTKEAPTAPMIGRRLPEFRIPGQRHNDFFNDIFGWENHDTVVRSRTPPSKASSEELSPPRPAVSVAPREDSSCFGSNFRPINVESRRASTRMAFRENKRNTIPPPFAFSQPCCSNEDNTDHNNFKSHAFPETISLEPMSNGSMRVSVEDLDLKSSPSSPVSAVYQSSNQAKKTEDEEDEEEDMGSYVIEIDSENREGTCESNGVDEAIAWVKEKFQMKSSTEENSNGYGVSDQGHTDSFGSLDERRDRYGGEEETEQFEYMVQTEMQILDAKINLWSTGKESDIRLLLSSLHQILWPKCGWISVPVTSLAGASQVKKAYQKARLCLHPDKVQQRGATIPQKHVAKKAFSVLQDAWASFVAQEVLR